MAKMYPNSIEYVNAPYSEGLVYKALSNLNDDFVIFHSIQWTKRSITKSFTWYENDFLILHKELGLLILEVKGGRIYFENGVFHQVNSETKEDVSLNEGNDPLSQAKRGIYHFRNILEKRIKGISGRLSIEPCVWFPSVEISECPIMSTSYEDIRDIILDSNSLKSPSKAIYNVFEKYNAKDVTDITDEEFQMIRDSIAPDFDLIPSPSIVRGELDNMFLRLTNEQAGLLDYLVEQRTAAIQGAAGTGKTLIALEAARRFSAEGNKVLFLCFNRFLYEHLKFDCPIENVDFYNINTFVGKYTKLDINSPKIRTQELQKIDPDKFEYSAIIIDEAQDFESDEIQFLSELCELKNALFYAFFDKNQLLTTTEIPSWIKNAECRLVLHKNCRNTYEIACTSYNVIDVEIKAQISYIKGTKPTLTFANNKDLLKLGKLIKSFKEAYKDSEIAILSLVPENESIMKDVNKIDGIQITRERNNKNVFYTTAKKFKGLESKVVIITDIDESCFTDDAQKRVFYVACSRAMHKLALFVSGNDDDIKNIGKSIKDLKMSAKGNILTKTRTDNFNPDD